ncbi:MAG: hypothetical protein PSN35_02820 [Candidatus Thioglobus sp.]|nr:hypothetical protein [Candidatus Thioglobus sp.]MDC9726754.1 hypothetical protein [Candidatus Thioglobus sp.]
MPIEFALLLIFALLDEIELEFVVILLVFVVMFELFPVMLVELVLVAVST